MGYRWKKGEEGRRGEVGDGIGEEEGDEEVLEGKVGEGREEEQRWSDEFLRGEKKKKKKKRVERRGKKE